MNTKEKLTAIVESGLKQEEVAALIGVSQPTVSRILSNKQQDMRMSTAQAISDLHAKVCSSAERVGDAA